MAIINPPFYIYPEQVADMKNMNLKDVRKQFSRMRKCIGKANRKPISITEYCQFEDSDRNDVEAYLIQWIARNRSFTKSQNPLRKVAWSYTVKITHQ